MINFASTIERITTIGAAISKSSTYVGDVALIVTASGCGLLRSVLPSPSLHLVGVALVMAPAVCGHTVFACATPTSRGELIVVLRCKRLGQAAFRAGSSVHCNALLRRLQRYALAPLLQGTVTRNCIKQTSLTNNPLALLPTSIAHACRCVITSLVVALRTQVAAQESIWLPTLRRWGLRLISTECAAPGSIQEDGSSLGLWRRRRLGNHPIRQCRTLCRVKREALLLELWPVPRIDPVGLPTRSSRTSDKTSYDKK